MSTAFEALILRDIAANRPAAGKPGRLFYDTTNGKMQRDNGSTWDDVEGTNITALLTTFTLPGDISPAQITSDQNDYNPSGLSGASVLRLNTDASRNITGLQGGADGRIIVIVNVGSTDLVLKDSDGGSSAANQFALSADITMGGDDGVILQYDSTSSRWRCIGKSPGGAGGGAPTTSEYVTTASDAGLSAEVAIPGLAGSADRNGVYQGGAAVVDYEFDSGASPLTWSAAVDTENVDTTVKSHLYVEDNGASETFGTFSWSPAGAFDIACKVSLGLDTVTTGAGFGLVVGDSAMNNRVALLFTLDTALAPDFLTVKAFTYAASTYTQGGGTIPNATSVVYLRITRDGSNNHSFYWSSDGLLWNFIATQALTYTAAKAGIRINPVSTNIRVAVDWIRTTV